MVGEVIVNGYYGFDEATGQYICPIKVYLGIQGRGEVSIVLAEKASYAAIQAGSYQAAAELLKKLSDVVIEDSTIQDVVQHAGEEAERMTQERVNIAMDVRGRQTWLNEIENELPGGKFSLVIMMDGWMARDRDHDWGLKPASRLAKRVAWHEMKSGIIFRLQSRAKKGTRRVIIEKFHVCWQGDPEEFGRRIYAEALRRGLTKARRVYVVADGGAWLWNIAKSRFPQAQCVLDYYHATQHLWAVAHELYPNNDDAAKKWISPLLRDLDNGKESRVIHKLEMTGKRFTGKKLCNEEKVATEIRYFQEHKQHMHYQQIEKEGCPKGSGAMESTCAQFQTRFKRTGQFWSLSGKKNLMALYLTERNCDWFKLWSRLAAA